MRILHSGQRSFPSLFWLLAIAFSLAHTTQVAAADDDSKTQRLSYQDFNFRIDSPDQKQEPIAPKVDLPVRPLAKRVPNTHPQMDVGWACPVQTAPEFPRKAQQEGIESVVTAQIRIKDGVVQEVMIVQGHPLYDATVKAAIMKYKCRATGPGEVIVTQIFNFELK